LKIKVDEILNNYLSKIISNIKIIWDNAGIFGFLATTHYVITINNFFDAVKI
jgi:hypothetical protein